MAHLAPMTGRRWMAITAVVCFAAAAIAIPWRLGTREAGNGQAALAAETGGRPGGGGGGGSVGGGGGLHLSSGGGAPGANVAGQQFALSDVDPKLLRHYRVGKKVSDFPDREDLSTPERTYAYCARLLASGEMAPWARVSAHAGRGGGGGLPRADVPPEVARGWLNAGILEVWLYRQRYAAVIARVTLPSEAFYDLRAVEMQDGRWLNLGESQHSTIEGARASFARFCLVRYPEIVLRQEAIARAMDRPEQFISTAHKLFQDIRGADYQYFLTSTKPDVSEEFPADYCAETAFDRWVNWVCTTFSTNPITDVQLGKAFRGQDGLPVVPYTLTLKDGGTLSGELPFHCSVEDGRIVWQATTGLDWHLPPGK